jgi:hypothetical protein
MHSTPPPEHLYDCTNTLGCNVWIPTLWRTTIRRTQLWPYGNRPHPLVTHMGACRREGLRRGTAPQEPRGRIRPASRPPGSGCASGTMQPLSAGPSSQQRNWLVTICWGHSGARLWHGAARGLLVGRNDPLAHSVSHKGSLVC